MRKSVLVVLGILVGASVVTGRVAARRRRHQSEVWHVALAGIDDDPARRRAARRQGGLAHRA
ncbi:hypothetical protein [Acidipropionibacterium timonense]|uniref:hypothetical protein n=1 Tax=Acidipropionibacterium timonense TaxID=2161818 RepID=UPI001030AC9D|nr:hypothetical protein [Acidipropionibacterium timonense]